MNPDSISEEYLRLALAIDQHMPGYIDAYFGPPDWKEQVQRGGPHPLKELSRRADELAGAIAADGAMDSQRKDYLARQVRAMQTSLRLLAGEKMPLADEVELLYDIRPAWVDETVFEQAQRQLDELLPPGGTLQERMAARDKAMEISTGKARELLPVIHARLRDETRRRFPLPEQESFEFHFVTGQPWLAYNWYLGGGRSKIELNTDLPLRAGRLVSVVAHEAYPGHHTELCIKDSLLLQGQGRLEHSVVLLNSPACVVSEGIATNALSVIMPEDALQTWYAQEIFPRAGVDPSLAEGEPVISRLRQALSEARGNVAFQMHDRGVDDDALVRYLQRFELLAEPEARKAVAFIRTPLDRSYIFTYGGGRQLLASLFAAKRDVTRWYTRVLSEAVTPSQIRQWAAG